MAKSRKRKGHAKRIANRNAEILNEKKRQQKEINKMIEQYKTLLEQEAKSTLGIENTEDDTEKKMIVEDAIEVEERDTNND